MEGQPYRHILYYSPSHIEQLFVDRIGEATQVTKEEETQKSQKLMAGLKVFLNGGIEGQKQDRKNVIKSVNQSEEHVQTKKVVNDLLQDESIPRIKDLDLDNISPLYRFSCECQFLPTESDMGDSKMVEVVGKEGDFKFRGITSLENWSSLSDTLYAVKNEIPYPLDGIVQLKDINDQMMREEEVGGWVLERADCDVNFVFISQSDPNEVQKWWNRRDLLGEYYEKQGHSK
jgi:hypothetical protein